MSGEIRASLLLIKGLLSELPEKEQKEIQKNKEELMRLFLTFDSDLRPAIAGIFMAELNDLIENEEI